MNNIESISDMEKMLERGYKALVYVNTPYTGPGGYELKFGDIVGKFVNPRYAELNADRNPNWSVFDMDCFNPEN